MHSIDRHRKDDHLTEALSQQSEIQYSSFDDIRFIHHSLGTISADEISLETEWAGVHHPLPIYINGMTGGTHRSYRYNQLLAEVARETGIAMASGSMSIALKQIDDRETLESFTIIRKTNPDGFVMANLGAGHSLDNARRVVEILEADALQIHLNRPQEVIMPEGDRDFSKWHENIAAIVEGIDVPVIVKEVGFGMSRQTIETLINLGVRTIDLSGRGGTNFAKIENNRRQALDLSRLTSWGQTTAESLLESIPFQKRAEILASGGVRDYFDMTRALALGARATGISGHILNIVDQGGTQAGIDFIEQTRHGLAQTFLLLDVRNIHELQSSDYILTGALREWAIERNISLNQSIRTLH